MARIYGKQNCDEPRTSWEQILNWISGNSRGGIHEALVDFFNTHYSADQMNLVVYSNMDLDSGEKLVRSLFGQIRNINAGSIYPEEPLFTDEQLPAKLISKTIKDINQLSLTFPVPSLTEHYQSKPDRYITNILGHEGPGSLHAYLNEKGWIESLGAGSQSFDKNTSLIVINIAMTNQGQKKRTRLSERCSSTLISCESNRSQSPFTMSKLP